MTDGGDSSQLLAFIKVELTNQACELLTYLQSKGADVSPEPSSEGVHVDLANIIANCDVCFTDTPDADIEAVLNSVVSMIILENVAGHNQLVLQFCEKLSSSSSCQRVCLKVLSLLYSSLRQTSPVKYDVYYHLVSLAGKVDEIDSVFSSIPEMESSLGPGVSVEQKQKLLRLIYKELLNNKHSESAARVMIELLRTYTEENASQAREEAQRCVLDALADPDTYLLDHLLTLKPVTSLQGTPVHQLLQIFVSGDLNSYRQFQQANAALMHSWGLDQGRSELKMRQLTFMQMAQDQPVMSFDSVQTALGLQEFEVEAFIIEVFRTRLVRGRMDQLARRVLISSTTPRTFGRPQWQRLRDILTTWKSNVAATRDSMETVVAAQTELISQLTAA